MKQRIFALIGTLAVLFTNAAFSQTRELGGEGRLLDGVAAIVDEGVVLKSELRQQVALIIDRLRQQGTQLPPLPVLERQILEQLIVRRIQLQRAERFGIVVGDDLLNRQLAQIAENNNTTLEELPRVLSAEGIDYVVYRQDMREQITLQQLQQRDVVGRISVSPREMEACLIRRENSASDAIDYNISHILIGLPAAATPGQLDEAKRKINDIYQRLEDGEQFAELAVSFSDGQTALEGGELGWRKGSQLPTLFADTVVELDTGGVSEPIQTGSGFHIVRLNETRGAEKIMVDQIRVRHILMTPNEILDSAAVEQKLSGVRENIIGGEDFAAAAKAMSEDPGSASEGGDLGWAGPGTFAPEFEQVLASLETNQLSEPFRTRFGWHIAEIVDRREYDTTEDVKNQQCFQEIRASKTEEETELWLRRLRDEAYVEYRM